MAKDKFLNLQGLTEVARYVNEKLKTVTEMPTSPNVNDVVLYKGDTTADYKQGVIYLYTTVETYYKWGALSDIYYTKAEAPQVGDTVYSDTTGTDSGFTIEAYDGINNQITVNSLIYDRDTTGDAEINSWVSKGGTSVVLNGADKTGDEANFYAPTASGEEGQVLLSNGENKAPSWASFDGYCPQCIDNVLCFYYGIIPEVENTAIVFDI